MSDELDRLRQLVARAPVALAIVEGPERVYRFANPAYLALIGGRDVRGRARFDALPELRGQSVSDALEQVFATGAPYVGAEVPVRLDRSGRGVVEERFFTFAYEPLPGADGAVEAVLISARDVTEEVLARQRNDLLTSRLQEAEERYRAIRDAGIIGVVEWHAAGRISAANDAFLAMVGRARAELEAGTLDFRALTPAHRQETTERALAAVAATGIALPFETQILRRDGGVVDVLVASAALDPAGAHGVSLVLDISGRKAAEDELRARAELEQYLLGIVSHDLRNPLNAIVLGAQVLGGRAELDERALRTVARIRSSAERAARMIGDLLDFTRARLGGGLELRPGPADLHAIARQVADELEAIHATRDIHLRGEGDCAGHWDADRLAQAVGNLVSNAIKYSPEGSDVDVVTRGEPDAVSVVVHNAGEPIPADKLERIFEPFQRAGSDPDSGRSIGLGLFIVRHIARAHGGEVTVTSSAEGGTTFTLRLPRAGSGTLAR